MYGGRARRIDLAKKGVIVLICLIVIFVSLKYATRKEIHYDVNQNYALLSNFFANRDFVCTDLVASGGKCTKNNSDGVQEFTRYNDGFTYIESTSSYVLSILYQKETPKKNGITLKTTNNALLGYKKKEYTCYTKDGIVSDFDKCLDEEKVELDSNMYLGVVESSIVLVREALYSSGYDYNTLMNDFKWVRVV